MEQIRARRHGRLSARGLSERLRDLLKGAQIDPQRLAQEAAILADRSDIGEELARLKIHSAQLAGMLDGGGEIGKKLDFLLQEMNRETNTILSKTSGAGEAGLKITELALEAKAAIEKIREQSLESRMTTVFIISAPSGSGKSTLTQQLAASVFPTCASRSPTPPAPRAATNATAKNIFSSRARSSRTRVARGEFLEHAEVFGNYYGTHVSELDRAAGRAWIWSSTSTSRVRDN